LDVLECLGFKDDMTNILGRLRHEMSFCDDHAASIRKMMGWLPNVQRFFDIQGQLSDAFEASCSEAEARDGRGQALITRMVLACKNIYLIFFLNQLLIIVLYFL
jgi:hypothetical protein